MDQSVIDDTIDEWRIGVFERVYGITDISYSCCKVDNSVVSRTVSFREKNDVYNFSCKLEL